MKPINNIINKKVLVICNSNGPDWKRIYCSFFIGKIIEYNPENNTVNIENKNKQIRTYNIVDHIDPFISQYDCINGIYKYELNKMFAYYRSDDIIHKIWYNVFIGDMALTILKNNIKQSRSQYVYKSCCLSSFSYGNKTKKRFLRDLLNELEKNYQ